MHDGWARDDGPKQKGGDSVPQSPSNPNTRHLGLQFHALSFAQALVLCHAKMLDCPAGRAQASTLPLLFPFSLESSQMPRHLPCVVAATCYNRSSRAGPINSEVAATVPCSATTVSVRAPDTLCPLACCFPSFLPSTPPRTRQMLSGSMVKLAFEAFVRRREQVRRFKIRVVVPR